MTRQQSKMAEEQEKYQWDDDDEEEDDEMPLPKLPVKILKKLKKLKGAVILVEEPNLSMEFPNADFLELIDCDDDPYLIFTPNQALPLNCRIQIMNVCDSFSRVPKKITSQRVVKIQNSIDAKHLPYSFSSKFRYSSNAMKLLSRLSFPAGLNYLDVVAPGTCVGEAVMLFENLESIFKISK